jgi:Uma2 family endonuclease
MTQQLQPPARLSVREYVAQERDAPFKSEFHNGLVVAMAGGSPEHGLIATNFTRTVGNQFAKGPCTVYNSDVRVSVRATRRFFYPDASIVCDELQRDPDDNHAITNPKVIAEVLSPSTTADDRGMKFSHYLQLPSLQCYILIEQDRPHVEVLTKQSDGLWLHSFAMGLDAVADVPAVGVTLKLSEIYAKVVFPPVADDAKP